MTKSRPSAIKLRLSRLVRCLLALGCIKLAIMGVALFDLPMPSWGGAESDAKQDAPVAKENAILLPVQQESVTAQAKPAPDPKEVEIPQGSAAAELAAAAKPRTGGLAYAVLPAPLLGAGPVKNPGANPFIPLLPTPGSLGAPLAKAGIILPKKDLPRQDKREESFWNALDINSLPIPGLGSVKAAQAAALDMPVPPTPGNQSPFTPAEQLSPTGGQHPTVLPGAPALPGNLPHGQSANGAPLAPRQYDPANSGYQPPAPNIPAHENSLDPNVQSQELARQQQDILMLRQQMDQRLKDLKSAEDKMKDILREAKDIEDKKVKNLVLMYANMKPRMAAQALEKMDERIAVRILSGMAPKQSGEILTYTNPSKTAKFTEMITRLRMME